MKTQYKYFDKKLRWRKSGLSAALLKRRIPNAASTCLVRFTTTTKVDKTLLELFFEPDKIYKLVKEQSCDVIPRHEYVWRLWAVWIVRCRRMRKVLLFPSFGNQGNVFEETHPFSQWNEPTRDNKPTINVEFMFLHFVDKFSVKRNINSFSYRLGWMNRCIEFLSM